MQNVILAQESSAGNPVLNMIVFGVFIVATMAVGIVGAFFGVLA